MCASFSGKNKTEFSYDCRKSNDLVCLSQEGMCGQGSISLFPALLVVLYFSFEECSGWVGTVGGWSLGESAALTALENFRKQCLAKGNRPWNWVIMESLSLACFCLFLSLSFLPIV